MIRLQSIVSDPLQATMRDLARAAPAGAILEVGVYLGGTAQTLEQVANAKDEKLWLYDTFAGLPWADPDKGDRLPVGQFADGLTFDECKYVFPGAVVQRGIFPHGVELPEAIGFAHLDVDQYRSVREAIDAIVPRLVPDGIILLDDYCLPGCERAVLETPHKRPGCATRTGAGTSLWLEILADGRAVLRRRRRA